MSTLAIIIISVIGYILCGIVFIFVWNAIYKDTYETFEFDDELASGILLWPLWTIIQSSVGLYKLIKKLVN